MKNGKLISTARISDRNRNRNAWQASEGEGTGVKRASARRNELTCFSPPPPPSPTPSDFHNRHSAQQETGFQSEPALRASTWDTWDNLEPRVSPALRSTDGHWERLLVKTVHFTHISHFCIGWQNNTCPPRPPGRKKSYPEVNQQHSLVSDPN